MLITISTSLCSVLSLRRSLFVMCSLAYVLFHLHTSHQLNAVSEKKQSRKRASSEIDSEEPEDVQSGDTSRMEAGKRAAAKRAEAVSQAEQFRQAAEEKEKQRLQAEVERTIAFKQFVQAYTAGKPKSFVEAFPSAEAWFAHLGFDKQISDTLIGLVRPGMSHAVLKHLEEEELTKAGLPKYEIRYYLKECAKYV